MIHPQLPSRFGDKAFPRQGSMASVEQVIILKGDRLSGFALREAAVAVFPSAVVELSADISAVTRLLENGRPTLLVTGINPTLEGDVLELIGNRAKFPCALHVLAVISREEDWLLGALERLEILGAFDTHGEDSPRLKFALETVAAGGKYWSPGLLDRVTRLKMSPQSLANRLTLTELVVLALAGGGCDDTEAAAVLDVQPTTVASVRRSLHRKLNVQHRGELIRTAAQHGFVQFCAAGIIRPGFGLLLAEYQAMKRRDQAREKSAPSTSLGKLTPFSRSDIDPGPGFSMVPRHAGASWRADARNIA